MAESRYCSEADLRALVPDVYRDAALADSFGGANADPGMLDLVLSSACDEVDALISGRVRLPLPADAIPSKLRTAAALFAAETLCIRRGAIMPEALAAKVKWWRDWLSKVGEGDLRLAATPESDDEAGKSSASMPAAITARPAITGSSGLLGAIALLLSLGAALLPGIALAAVGHRTFSLAAPPDPATFSSVPAIVWERGESVTLTLAGASIGPGQNPSWQIADPSNLWFSVASTNLSFHASPETAAIPAGRYVGRVIVTNADSSLVRVLAVQSVYVIAGAPNLQAPPPESAFCTPEWVESVILDVSNALHEADLAIGADVATNAAAIAARPTFDWVAAYVATNSSGGGSAPVDTNAIVAAAVEAGRSEFYGLGDTNFAAGAERVDFGFRAEDAHFGLYATTASFGTSATEAWLAQGAEEAHVGYGVQYLDFGLLASESYVFATQLQLGTNDIIRDWSDIGGGGSAWQPTTRVISSPTYTVSADDCLVWLDSEAAQTNQVVTLPDLAVDGQIVTIRHLGGDFPATIQRGTSTYTLQGDGAALTCDWLAAKTNWYWRTAW